jgi:hypothetical protein
MSESVFHIQKAACSLQIFRARKIHREATTEQGEQVLLHYGAKLAIPVDFIGRSPGKQLLTDEGQFLAPHVLERELVSEAERLAIDEEHVLTVWGLDREVVAPAKQLLFHPVAHRQVAEGGSPHIMPFQAKTSS